MPQHNSYITYVVSLPTSYPMSSRSAKSQEKVARRTVTSWIDDFYRSKLTSHGLPEDVLVHALDGYGDESLSWPLVRSKAQEFHRYVAANVSDCTIRRVFRRPVGRKEPVASVSIFRLMAEPLRHSQTLFGANTYTFTFWPAGVWFLSTTEPLFTTDHLHQRLVERASKSEQSLAEAQELVINPVAHIDRTWPTAPKTRQTCQHETFYLALGRWSDLR